MNDVEKPHYYECACHADEHLLKFQYFQDDEYPELFVTVFLDELPWYSRIIRGIKYIFGYKSKYGHFYSWTINNEDINRMIEMLETYKMGLKAAENRRLGNEFSRPR